MLRRDRLTKKRIIGFVFNNFFDAMAQGVEEIDEVTKRRDAVVIIANGGQTEFTIRVDVDRKRWTKANPNPYNERGGEERSERR